MTDWPRKHKWWTDAARLYLGLITRAEATKRGVPRMTVPKYAAELAELKAFSEWVHWYNTGRRGPRPHFDLPVPRWAWLVEAEFHKAHPHPPPGPPPPPADNSPSRWKDAPWTKKFVAVSHGMRKADRVWSPEQLVQRAKAAGCGAVFAQIGNDTPDPDWAEHARQLIQAAHAESMQGATWGRGDYIPWPEVKAMIEAVGLMDGFKLDVEGRCQDDQLPEHLVAEFPGLPLAVVATGGIDDAFGDGAIESAKRFGDFFDFVGQDYAKAGTPLEVDPAGHGENFVYWRSTAKVKGGYRRLPDALGRWHVPMVMPHAEGCPPLEAYRESLKAFTPHYGVWDGELLEGYGEWGVFASI